MNKRFLNKFYILLASLFLIFLTGQGVLASETVNIFTTNDIHGNVETTDTNIGMAQTAAIAASNDNSVLIDAGDATQGASFASVSQGEDVIKLMNAAGYDAMAAGNHEFDYGVDQLTKNVKLSNFPVISANVKDAGRDLLNPTTIIKVAGKNIGLIGLTTTSTATSTNPSKLQGITFEDEVQAAKDQIARLGNVDTIIIVGHLGDNAEAVSCTSRKLLDGLDDSELSRIGALIDGHSHTEEDSYYERGNVKLPIVQTGCYLTKIGHISLNFDDNGNVTGDVDLIDYDNAKNYQLNSQGSSVLDKVNSTLNEIKASQDKVLNQVICQNETPLWGGYIYYDYAEPRVVETNYGDFVTDAFKANGEIFTDNNKINLPVIGIENGGGISATLNAGEVKRGDILNAFNHGNMVEAIKVSPADLFAAMESGLVVTGQDENGTLQRDRVSGSFAQVSGLKYTYDPNNNSSEKITDITLDNGTKLSRDDTSASIVMVTNSYVASAFTKSEKLGELGGEDMIIQDYLLTKTNNGTVPLNVPITANRIIIANDRSPATYTVEIPIIDAYTVQDQNPELLSDTTVHLSVDGTAPKTFVSDSNGKIQITLSKGPHTLTVEESTDEAPVYVNNYSGSGTQTTKPGYYKLGFAVNSGKERIPTQSVSFNENTDSLILTTNPDSNTLTLNAKVEPANTTDRTSWSVDTPSVLEVTPNGNSAEIKAIAEGKATVTLTSGKQSVTALITVSNQPIISDALTIGTDNFDQFTAVAKNVRVNPNILGNSDIKDVCLYAWSSSNQSDIAAVHATQLDGTNDWAYTFTINGTKPNTYFNDASLIRIHAYADLDNGKTQFLNAAEYDYVDGDRSCNLVITPYAQNIGFIVPSSIEDSIAGTVGENRQLEGIRISSPIEGLELNYSVHAQDIGWMDPVTSGQYTGTMRENRQIEALRITLSGEQADNYSIEYQVHAQNIGWMDPVTDGKIAGTTGENRQIEAVRINLIKK